jgi:hypothetical protein
MPKAEATVYARTLNEVALQHDFDPLTAVAIVHFETHWLPGLVSADGEDYGLGQVRARFIGACRSDEDPVNAPSRACLAVKASLRDGVTNLRRMGSIIGANKDLCKDKTGTAKVHQWLAGYQGYGAPWRGQWCTPGEKTWMVLGYYNDLVAKLVPKPAPKVKPAPRPKPAAPPSKSAKHADAKVAAKAKPAARRR